MKKREATNSSGLSISLARGPWCSQPKGKLSNPSAPYLSMLSNTLDYHFITIMIRFSNERKTSGEQNSGTVTLRNRSLLKAIHSLQRANAPSLHAHGSCSFSSSCEQYPLVSWKGSGPNSRQGTKGYSEANTLRTWPCSAVTRCVVGESLGFIAVLIKMNTNKSLDSFHDS